MNLAALFHAHLALVLSVVTGVVIPYLSALATRAPSWLTGVLTLAISALSGFVAEWAAAGDGFDWRKGAATALAAWVVAILAHFSQLAGTPLQAQLHAVGTKRPAGNAG